VFKSNSSSYDEPVGRARVLLFLSGLITVINCSRKSVVDSWRVEVVDTWLAVPLGVGQTGPRAHAMGSLTKFEEFFQEYITG